jgi:sec-independent protein translocase protein TatA
MLGGIGYTEILLLGIVAVILFGRKLPEVARNVGNSYAQFRKGLSDIQSSINVEENDFSTNNNLEYEQAYDDAVEPSGPKFEPPVEEELEA